MATLDELFNELDVDLILSEDETEVGKTEEHLQNLVSLNSAFSTRQALAKTKFMQMMASRQREIRREAASDADNLLEVVSRKQLSKLIDILVKSDTEKIQKYKDTINGKYTRALAYWIPGDLLRLYRKYANTEHHRSVPRTPGFWHKNTPDWGSKYNFWVEPDLPIYVPQFSEQGLIESTKPEVIKAINRAIFYYYQTLMVRAKAEIKLASDLYSVYTRYDLLQLNPDFYKIYMTNKLYNI